MFSLRTWTALGLLLAIGCARPETASDKHFAQLSDSLAGVQADHDALDAKGTARADATAATAGATAGPRAKRASADSRVVRLVPTDGQSEGEPAAEEASDDAGERPSVRLVGAAGATSPRRRQRGDARIDPSTEDAAGSPARGSSGEDLGPDVAALRQAGGKAPSALDPEAKRSYERSLSNVWAKRYDTALEGFAQFLVTWPDHPYADNALYWRGECLFAKGDYAKAAEEFEGAASRFPLGNKAADALLKLAITQEKLGAPDKATQARERLLRDYPQSDAARKVGSRSAKPTERPVQEHP